MIFRSEIIEPTNFQQSCVILDKAILVSPMSRKAFWHQTLMSKRTKNEEAIYHKVVGHLNMEFQLTKFPFLSFLFFQFLDNMRRISYCSSHMLIGAISDHNSLSKILGLIDYFWWG